MDQKKAKKIIVSGDVTIDWLQACQGAQKTTSHWSQENNARLYGQPGGAAQVEELICCLLPGSDAQGVWELAPSQATPKMLIPGDPGQHHTYSLWAPSTYGLKPPMDREKPAWRIEHFLGIERSHSGSSGADKPQAGEDAEQADLLVLVDSNLGFRETPAAWSAALAGHPGWVVVKMAQPVAQGDLWTELVSKHADRLVVITTAHDLRKTAIQISQRISWERTAQDVAWELTYNPIVNSLSQAAYLIVSFDCGGAVLLKREKENRPKARLFFDPIAMEADWERGYPGGMLGYTTCLTAALVQQIILDPETPNFERGIQAGVSASRLLHKEGFGQRGSKPEGAGLGFPYASIAQEIVRQAQPLAEAEIQDPAGFLLTPPPPEKPRLQRGYWTILEDRYTDQLDVIARQIVLEGSDAALRQVPIGRFGALVTVDRREIEALNGIQRLIAEYCSSPQKKPLSIAVFGPPGAGKSFGVEQVAKSVSGGDRGLEL